MKRALLVAGSMLLGAAAAGCVSAEGLPSPSTQARQDIGDRIREERSHSGDRLAAACSDGNVPRERAGACLILAGYFQEGVFGLPHDPGHAALLWESAVDILQASCEAGEVEDCTRAASAMGMRLHLAGQPDGATSEAALWMVQYAEDGCRGGDVTGCALLGLIYERGRGVERNDERSRAYYDQACGGGHRQSCLLLASRAEGKAAVLAYERACEVGSGFACAAAGQHHRKGVAVEPSVEKAGTYFTKGCSLGNLAACVMGAEMYASIDGTPQDRRRAMQMAWDGCKDGIADGCLLLGELFERKPDRSAAREAYRRACALGEKRGCEAARVPAPKHHDAEGVEGEGVEGERGEGVEGD